MQEEQKKRIKYDYQTPSQILANHPKIKKIYTPQLLGYLLMCKVVDGKKLKRGCLISESDLLKFLDYRFGMKDV